MNEWDFDPEGVADRRDGEAQLFIIYIAEGLHRLGGNILRKGWRVDKILQTGGGLLMNSDIKLITPKISFK